MNAQQMKKLRKMTRKQYRKDQEIEADLIMKVKAYVNRLDFGLRIKIAWRILRGKW